MEELKSSINESISNKHFDEATRTLDIELENNKSEINTNLLFLAEIAGSYITVGSESNTPDVIEKGVELLVNNVELLSKEIALGSIQYSLANGYQALFELSTNKDWNNLTNIKNHLFKSKIAFLKALKLCNNKDSEYKNMLFTNLATNLKLSGRYVESLYYYDIVLSCDPNFPQALLNKYLCLKELLFTGNLEYRDAIFFESAILLTNLINSESPPKNIIDYSQEELFRIEQYITNQGKDFYKELSIYQQFIGINTTKISSSKFHQSKILKLDEISLYSKKNYDLEILMIGYKGLKVNKEIVKLEQRLNQIKSEFSLARTLYYSYKTDSNDDHFHYELFKLPLNYGLNMEKLRTSYRLCFGILDKIAESICVLYDLPKHIKENIYFESFWNNSKACPERWIKLNEIDNIHLTALFSLSCDLGFKGEFNFYKKWRNQLEHGTFIVTDKNTSNIRVINEIPNHVKCSIDEFDNSTIHLLQLTRSAIFSFVFCVRQKLSDESKN